MKSKRIGLGKGRGKGYTNLIKIDPYVHSLARKGKKMYNSHFENKMIRQKLDDYIHKRTTRPMISRVGGKTKIAKKICQKIPKHNIYVEPFVGGGSVFFQKEPVEFEVINDKDKDVALLYKSTKVVKPSDVEKINFKANRNKFESLKNSKPHSPFKQLEKSLYLNKNSYAGGSSYAKCKEDKYPSDAKNLKKRFPYYQMRLQNVKIHNGNFQTVMDKYDSKNTFYYLGPPYHEVSKNCYKHETITPHEVHNEVKKIKGKFLLSYNNHPEVKKEFKNYNIHRINTVYELQGSANKQHKTELLISNYN